MENYRTLKRNSEAIFKEKGSRFIAYAYPIDNKEDVNVKLVQLRKLHPKANHICTAFLLFERGQEYYLTNDDGEPSNSAGMPILGQIRSNELINTFIAVVRYFGGTKLGVGGLISAYKASAAGAINSNEIIEVEPKYTLQFKVEYATLGNVLSIIDKNQLVSKQIHADKQCTIILSVLYSEIDKVKSMFKPLRIKLEVKG